MKTITTKRRRGRPPLYPWTIWFQSGRVRLLQGRDYHCSTISMAEQIRAAASKHGISVSVGEIMGGLSMRTVLKKINGGRP